MDGLRNTLWIFLNLCSLDLDGAMQRCVGALGLLQCWCVICALFLPTVWNRAAAVSAGWPGMVRRHKIPLLFYLNISSFVFGGSWSSGVPLMVSFPVFLLKSPVGPSSGSISPSVSAEVWAAAFWTLHWRSCQGNRDALQPDHAAFTLQLDGVLNPLIYICSPLHVLYRNVTFECSGAVLSW